MLNDVQRQKLPRLFAMYDIDKNGQIDMVDFTQLRQKVMSIRGLPEGSAEAQALQTRFTTRFGHMQQFADPDQPERLTQEQWLNYMDQVINDPQAYQAEIAGTGGFIFSLFDTNTDGTLSMDEFRQFYRSLGLDEATAGALYSRIGLSDNATISKEQYMVMFDEFFKSEDPTAPGSILFGQ